MAMADPRLRAYRGIATPPHDGSVGSTNNPKSAALLFDCSGRAREPKMKRLAPPVTGPCMAVLFERTLVRILIVSLGAV